MIRFVKIESSAVNLLLHRSCDLQILKEIL